MPPGVDGWKLPDASKPKLFRETGKDLLKGVSGQIKPRHVPFHPHKKQVLGRIDMLVGMQDICAVVIEKICHCSHQAALVWCNDQ